MIGCWMNTFVKSSVSMQQLSARIGSQIQTPWYSGEETRIVSTKCVSLREAHNIVCPQQNVKGINPILSSCVTQANPPTPQKAPHLSSHISGLVPILFHSFFFFHQHICLKSVSLVALKLSAVCNLWQETQWEKATAEYWNWTWTLSALLRAAGRQTWSWVCWSGPWFWGCSGTWRCWRGSAPHPGMLPLPLGPAWPWEPLGHWIAH